MTKPTPRTRHDRRAARPAGPVADIEAAAIAAPYATTPDVYRPTPHAQIRPDPANPRKLFDADGFTELAASIAADGLLEPLLLRPNPQPEVDGPPFMLIAGERRWRAIGHAIEAGDWPADRPIPAMLRDVSEQDARRLALVENLQRRDLNAVETARALEQLAELTGASAAQIGRDLGFTERWAQQHLSLLKLPAAMLTQVETGAMILRDARELVGLLPKLPAVQQLAIEKGALTVASAKAWLAAQPKPLDLTAEQWLIVLEVYDKAKRDPITAGERLVEVHADARFDERLPRLRDTYLLFAVSHVLEAGAESGRFQIGTAYDIERQLKLRFGEAVATEGGRLRALDALYAELGTFGTPPIYQTAWLNGPFEISAALRAEIEVARQARLARDAQWQAERDADTQAREQVSRAHLERLATVRREAAGIAMAAASQRPLALAALAAVAEHPLPWRLNADQAIVNAEGGVVQRDDSWHVTPEQISARELIVGLVNAGAGLPTPAADLAAATQLDPEAAIGDTATGDTATGDTVTSGTAASGAAEAEDVEAELPPALLALAGVPATRGQAAA